MKKIVFVNNPDLTEENAVAVYSTMYDSVSIRIDSTMFENDGNCAGASFWGIDKARSNKFITVDIVVTEKRCPKEGEQCISAFGTIYATNHDLTYECDVIVASTGDQCKTRISQEDLREILNGKRKFDALVDAR